MTVPVTTKVDHRNGDLYSYEMCFFIPEEFQRYPPRPQNRKVHVVSLPELHVYSQYGCSLFFVLKLICICIFCKG